METTKNANSVPMLTISASASSGMKPASSITTAVVPRVTPYRVTIGTTAVVMLLAGFIPLDALAEMVSIGTLFAFFVVSIAVIVLRRTKPKMKRPFRTPSVPLLPIVSAVFCVGLMTNLALETWLRFLVWLVVGLAIYLFYGRTHSRSRPGARGGDSLDWSSLAQPGSKPRPSRRGKPIGRPA